MGLIIEQAKNIEGVDEAKAQLIVAVSEGKVKPLDLPDAFPKTSAWVRSCFNPPRDGEIAMKAFDELIEGFGVEGLPIEGIESDRFWGDLAGDYVNVGDSYGTTITRDRDGEYRVETMADFVEREEEALGSSMSP